MNNDPSGLDDKTLDAMIAHAHAQLHEQATTVGSQPWTPELIKFLTVSLLVFGVIVIGLMCALLFRGRDAGDILRLFTLPMVIVTAVILVILGYSNEQMTPVIGLLGTMVGYVLGTNQRGRNVASGRNQSDSPASTAVGRPKPGQ